ncbi:MAG: hypothetical protein ABIO16_10130, partial [Nocardioides sp.]
MRGLVVAALLPLALVSPAHAHALPQLGLHLDATVAEGATLAIVVTLDRPAARDVRVRIDTRHGGARAKADYAPVHDVVTVPAGRTRAVVR